MGRPPPAVLMRPGAPEPPQIFSSAGRQVPGYWTTLLRRTLTQPARVTIEFASAIPLDRPGDNSNEYCQYPYSPAHAGPGGV